VPGAAIEAAFLTGGEREREARGHYETLHHGDPAIL
jgi:hypothetical protein